EYTDASGRVHLCEMDTHPDWVGRSVRDLQRATLARVAFLTRFGEGHVPTPDELLQEGDVVHVLVTTERINDVQRVLAVRPRTDEACGSSWRAPAAWGARSRASCSTAATTSRSSTRSPARCGCPRSRRRSGCWRTRARSRRWTTPAS